MIQVGFHVARGANVQANWGHIIFSESLMSALEADMEGGSCLISGCIHNTPAKENACIQHNQNGQDSKGAKKV